MGPLFDQFDNNPEPSQPTSYEERYTTTDHGKKNKVLYNNYSNSCRNKYFTNLKSKQTIFQQNYY